MGKTCTSEFFKNVQNCMSPKDECNLFTFEKLMHYILVGIVLANQIGLLQNFALLLILQIFALLFGMNCTEIDQSPSSI